MKKSFSAEYRLHSDQTQDTYQIDYEKTKLGFDSDCADLAAFGGGAEGRQFTQCLLRSYPRTVQRFQRGVREALATKGRSDGDDQAIARRVRQTSALRDRWSGSGCGHPCPGLRHR